METKGTEHFVAELKVVEKGPLLVTGPVKIIMPDGTEKIMERCAICRCGRSKNQPFCDGSHAKV